MVRKDFLKDIHMSIMKEKVEDSNTPLMNEGAGGADAPLALFYFYLFILFSSVRATGVTAGRSSCGWWENRDREATHPAAALGIVAVIQISAEDMRVSLGPARLATAGREAGASWGIYEGLCEKILFFGCVEKMPEGLHQYEGGVGRRDMREVP